MLLLPGTRGHPAGREVSPFRAADDRYVEALEDAAELLVTIGGRTRSEKREVRRLVKAVQDAEAERSSQCAWQAREA
jgi:hypothetical protein